MLELWFMKVFLRYKGGRMQRKRWQTLAHGAIDTILPPRCVVSGVIVDRQGHLAPGAWRDLDFIAGALCKCCGIPFDFDNEIAAPDEMHCASCFKEKPEFTSARAVFSYNDTSRKLILSFKHGDQLHMVRAFMPWLLKAGAEQLAAADILVPVPLHPLRLISRRYNQAALLARGLSHVSDKPCLLGALKRTRATPSQGHLNIKERLENVRRAFVVSPRQKEKISGKRILLIDDVFTTGATVSECTRTLLKAGAREVHVLTLARVVRAGQF